MRNLNNLKRLSQTLIVCVLLSSLVSCKNKKIPMYKLCTTLEEVGFGCADQRVPDERDGKKYPYQAGMICMFPDDYKTITNFMVDQAKYIAMLENRQCQ